MRALLSVALLVAVVRPVIAQHLPAYVARLDVSVVIVDAKQRGDTASVAYAVTNGAQSTARVYLFTVPRVGSILSATPGVRPWRVLTRMGHQDVVAWASFDHTAMVPGATGPRLEYSSIGVLGVVQAWALPYTSVPAEGDVMDGTDPDPKPVFVTTIGIVPIPAGSTAPDLLGLVDQARSRVCGLDWIDNAGVCTSLSEKLAAATASLTRNDTTAARNQLGAFVDELEAQRGKHVSDNAYWLLRTNAEYVLSHLPQLQRGGPIPQ